MYDINFINSRIPSVTYNDWDTVENLQVLTLRFEEQFAHNILGCVSEDIGGLVVYSKNGNVLAVYDYENCCGWVV